MEIRISRGDYALLLRWADVAAPLECCGLLFGRCGHVQQVELTDNKAAEPERFFEIDPAALIAAEKKSRAGEQALIGYFHSHPNGRHRPSLFDAQMAAQDGRIWLIIAEEDISAWIYKGDEKFEQLQLILGSAD